MTSWSFSARLSEGEKEIRVPCSDSLHALHAAIGKKVRMTFVSKCQCVRIGSYLSEKVSVIFMIFKECFSNPFFLSQTPSLPLPSLSILFQKI